MSQGTTSIIYHHTTQGGKTKQQQDGDDGVVGIFVSKAPHLRNTVELSWSSCSPTAWSKMLWWRQQSQIPHGLASLSPILSISMSCEQTLTRSSLKPSCMALILPLFHPGAVQSTRSGWMVEDTVDRDCFKVCCSYYKVILRWWSQYFCHGQKITAINQKKWWSQKQKCSIIWRSCQDNDSLSLAQTSSYSEVMLLGQQKQHSTNKHSRNIMADRMLDYITEHVITFQPRNANHLPVLNPQVLMLAQCLSVSLYNIQTRSLAY